MNEKRLREIKKALLNPDWSFFGPEKQMLKEAVEAIEQAHREIHDLQQEQAAYQRGKDDQRHLSHLRLLDAWDKIMVESSGTDGKTREYLTTVANAYEEARGIILDEGDTRELLPPDELRKENERLTKALEQIRSLMCSNPKIMSDRAQEIARKAIGD